MPARAATERPGSFASRSTSPRAPPSWLSAAAVSSLIVSTSGASGATATASRTAWVAVTSASSPSRDTHGATVSGPSDALTWRFS